MPDIDRIIHEPARLVIVALLAALKEADFTYLLLETGLTKGNLSGHLSVLEAEKYVCIEKAYRGKTPWTLVHLTPEGRAAFKQYSKRLKVLLTGPKPD